MNRSKEYAVNRRYRLKIAGFWVASRRAVLEEKDFEFIKKYNLESYCKKHLK